MFFRFLSISFLAVGMATTAIAASGSQESGGDRGGWGDSPNADDYNTNYRNTITGRGDTSADDEKDPNACWTLPRSADGKSIVAPSKANPIVPRKCD